MSRSHPSFIRSCYCHYEDAIGWSGNYAISEAGNSCGSTSISIWHFLSCPWSEAATAADIFSLLSFSFFLNSHAFSFYRLLQDVIPQSLAHPALHLSGDQNTHSFNYAEVSSSAHYETGHICKSVHTILSVLERMLRKCVWTSRDHQADGRICDAERLCAFPAVLCENGVPHLWHAQCVCHFNAFTIQSTSWTQSLGTPPPSHSLFMHFSLSTQ